MPKTLGSFPTVILPPPKKKKRKEKKQFSVYQLDTRLWLHNSFIKVLDFTQELLKTLDLTQEFIKTKCEQKCNHI